MALILCFTFSCKDEKTKKEEPNKSLVENNDEIAVYNFDELEPLLYSSDDEIHIINFWAMWCAPCIKELPYLQAFANKNSNVKLTLVSLDFAQEIETKLKPFLAKKNIIEKVILLDDPDSNTWIDKIDPSWSGAIPFTIIFNNDKRFYYERSFENLTDLENEINKNFNL
ncbi:TlpA disulfide reductase family protein [Aurantibacter sp.]|uniref:TlpA disulfide reductase family protein n=1 Tax=Aurantibacter sp. TaxID=2807103 RepID=UPI003263E620